MHTQFINPAGIAPPNGYTHVVTTDARKLVFISGQIGVDANGEMKGGLAAQTTQVFENLRVAPAIRPRRVKLCLKRATDISIRSIRPPVP